MFNYFWCNLCCRNIPEKFKEMLVHLTQTQKPLSDNRIAMELQEVAESGSEVILMLARCLPHVVPNILLAKREVNNRKQICMLCL